jgi:hypothetical protein
LRRNIGQCPVDVAQFDTDLYVLDANQNCRTDFSTVGPSRLLRLRFASSVIDTIPLGANVIGASNMSAQGSSLYVAGFGEVNFGTGAVTQSGTVVKYDMDNRNLIVRAPTPLGTFGTVVAPGRDGVIYASVYGNATTFPGRVIRMDSTVLAAVAPFAPGGSFAPLVAPDSSLANCVGVGVDTRGRVYCPVVGVAGASKLYVYNLNYLLIRTLNVGQGAVAVQAR